MTLRTQLTWSYFAILSVGFLLVGGWTYYELVVEHPVVDAALALQGQSAREEFLEIMLYGGLPALVLALGGGWILIRRALNPIAVISRTVEQVHASNLGQPLPRLGKGRELDHLNEVLASMMRRLNDSFTHVRDFTLHASHELKTPLTILRGEIESRVRDPALPDVEREFFAAQLEEISRLTKIVDSLTLLTKADAGALALDWEPVRLDELVRESFADAQMLAHAVAVRVELTDCDEITVRGDPHRLRQLLLNLADNAIKYNQPGGWVRMALVARNGRAELAVINTGPGMPPSEVPRVFERFYRGSAARSNPVEGSGLGLSIAESIVKAHGGTIRLESGLEKHTSVHVMLPMRSGDFKRERPAGKSLTATEPN
ncbi:MAG: HAMP domain-containing histidine kinase [Verrucomicrobiae bacterium]|nr:HAMP domain-containing histidine kinase [Verrucomicrobiae bacterium]